MNVNRAVENSGLLLFFFFSSPSPLLPPPSPQALQSVVDLDFQYNPPILPVSDHRNPISYSHYLHILFSLTSPAFACLSLPRRCLFSFLRCSFLQNAHMPTSATCDTYCMQLYFFSFSTALLLWKRALS